MDPKRIAREIVEKIFNDRNLGEVDRLVAPSCRDHAIPHGEKNGADGVRAVATSLWQAFPDGRFTLEEVFGEGELVTTCCVFEGTHQGHFCGVPPTGRRVRLESVDVVRVVNGQCVEHWGGFEAGAVISQLALQPRPVMEEV
ncbi:MAG: ester cyclase [Myxococcota bacterium]